MENTITYRWMAPEEIEQLREIDRTEIIRTGYKYADGELQKIDVNWDAPNWDPNGDHEFSMTAQINFCRDHLEKGGKMYGAFDEKKLVGIGIITPNIQENVVQLAYLHMSKGYRRMGVGNRIFSTLVEKAKQLGGRQMYVTAVPSGSAVGFYLSKGFQPTDSPIPELFELEPDDIHMIKSL